MEELRKIYPDWANKIFVGNIQKENPKICEMDFNPKKWGTFTIYIYPPFYESTNQKHELVKALVRAHNARPTNFVRTLLKYNTLQGYNQLYDQTVEEFANVLEAQLSPY